MAHRTDSDHRKMRVTAKDVVADDVVSVTLADVDGGDLPDWEPGAHIDLVLDEDTIRQYSLCGDPAESDHYRIAVLREPNGRGGSAAVHDRLQAGDVVDVKGPRNHFPLVSQTSYLFIAGGIGITPMIPMMSTVDARGADWSLLYGGRTAAGMAFAQSLSQRYPGRVTLRPQDEHGLLDLADALDSMAPGTSVYCCGPEPLLSALENLCHERDVELHLERFAPKVIESSGADTSFDVVLEQSGETITVAESESILDALLRAGVDADFSCREGTCGTCEVAVLDGVPDHRDSVLTEDEQAENDCMMVCVSRSCSKKLVIDL